MAASFNILVSHTFTNNPLRSNPDHVKPSSALEFLNKAISVDGGSSSSEEVLVMVLPFRNGRPLARSSDPVGDSDAPPIWYLGWLLPSDFRGISVSGESFVYLGSLSKEDADVGCGTSLVTTHWAIDVSDHAPGFLQLQGTTPGGPGDPGSSSSFVDLRTLMVATDWADQNTMTQLAIAGHAKALLEWRSISRYCGHCGSSTKPIDAGRRKQCTQESCKKRIYPRVDPVVIMLVIDEDNDRALLSRQSRFVPRMWSCLAGFLEPGESLEEAVKRETLEETGIEVREVVYHSSQPWPVGPSSMPCQLMVGFFAYAKSLEIRVDKTELEDAQWHSRDDVKKALAFTEYAKAQRTSAFKVNQMCKGIPKDQGSVASDVEVESGELAPMFIPGPFAIAHHLISSWANNSNLISDLSSYISNL